MKIKSLFFAFLFICISLTGTARDFRLGGDISRITEDEARGRQLYTVDGIPADIFTILKDYGINSIRLRVWVNPTGGYCSPEDMATVAVRSAKAGMPVMVDFHYSDWWADPSKQNIPAAWNGKSFEETCALLADHTRSTLRLLKDKGVDVRWVQVGNETSNGMLWPLGKLDTNPYNYARLTKAGYDAVKEVYPDAKVIVHLDKGFDQGLYDWAFDTLKSYGAEWDMIGMSVYPYWAILYGQCPDEESTLRDAIANIRHLKQKYDTDVMIVEVGVDAREPEKGYDFMVRFFDEAIDNTEGACAGVFYWSPEWNADEDYHLGAFDNDRPTKIMEAFRYATQKVGGGSGIDSPVVDNDGPAEYYRINGTKVTPPLAPGIYIERRNGEARKFIVR